MAGKFLKVRCKHCKNEQVIFSKASSRVECINCGKEISEAMGSKARIKTTVLGPVK
jgi:small subunit ribosomal protein S27e